MRMPNVTQKIVDTLQRYAKTIYLTQTVEKKDGKLNRFLNLEDAFKAWESDPGPREWRTHFHVPVFLDDLGEFGTTRFAIEDALKFHKAEAAVAPARDRDLHLGRAAGSSQDRRHRRLCLARDRMGARAVAVSSALSRTRERERVQTEPVSAIPGPLARTLGMTGTREDMP